MFDNLKNRIEAEAAETVAHNRFYIENGYCETWSEEHRNRNDEGIKRYSTARRWDQYNAGEISREKAVELAAARMEKQEAKHTGEKLEKLEKAAAAPELIDVTISVEWKRSSVWGYNPAATVTIHTENGWSQYTGSASGCGYDKRTAAIGAALNQSDSIKKMLYRVKEAALANMGADEIAAQKKGYVFGSESNRNYINYGAGYGVLPYFEGGVGIASFKGVFEKCGYPCRQEHETKHNDYYFFAKGEN